MRAAPTSSGRQDTLAASYAAWVRWLAMAGFTLAFLGWLNESWLFLWDSPIWLNRSWTGTIGRLSRRHVDVTVQAAAHSSLVAGGIMIGMLLAFTRNRPQGEIRDYLVRSDR